MTEIPDTEVEWTWTAPTAEKTAASRSAPVTAAGGQAGATVSTPPVATTGSGSGTAVKNSPAVAAGTTPGPATGAVSSGAGAVTGGTPATPSASSTPIPSAPATSSLFDPIFGDSTGYALVPPKIRDRPATVFPVEAIRAGMSGNVLLLVEVLEDGRVGKIVVNRSSGSKILDESARENVSRWRFEPARQPQGNKPVRAMTAVWVRYVKEVG